MEEFESAREVALRFIDFAPRTSVEVERRLARAGFEATTVAAVIADLERAGLLDDAQFSRDWVEDRNQRKGLGRARLGAELRRKGVERSLVEEALGGIDPAEEVGKALELARQKAGREPLDDPGARRRLAGFLQRRGYSWAIIEQVFAKLSANND